MSKIKEHIVNENETVAQTSKFATIMDSIISRYVFMLDGKEFTASARDDRTVLMADNSGHAYIFDRSEFSASRKSRFSGGKIITDTRGGTHWLTVYTLETEKFLQDFSAESYDFD